jgi:hypothetical protein
MKKDSNWEKSALDKKLDKKLGYKEDSKADLAADRKAKAQKAKGMSDKEILAKATAKAKLGKPTQNKLMGKKG